jgi:hypothetical protein
MDTPPPDVNNGGLASGDRMSFGRVQIGTVPVLVLPVATRDTASPSHSDRSQACFFLYLFPTASRHHPWTDKH